MDATSDAQTKQKIAEAFHLGELPPDLFSRPTTTSHPKKHPSQESVSQV
jgi:hypothetical protein